VITLHDATARMQTETVLRQYQLRFEEQKAKLWKLSQAIAQSANTVVVTDLEGRIEYMLTLSLKK